MDNTNLYWFYAVAGKQEGPIDFAAMSAAIAAGTIRRETLVWSIGMPAWKPAGETILREIFATPPPLPAGMRPSAPPAAGSPALPSSESPPPVPLSNSPSNPTPTPNQVKLAKNKPGFFQNYFSSEGRIDRVSWLARSLVIFVVSVFSAAAAGDGGILFWFLGFSMAMIYGSKRLHDMGKSGVWVLVMLIPVANLVLYISLLGTPGEPGPNKYGLPP